MTRMQMYMAAVAPVILLSLQVAQAAPPAPVKDRESGQDLYADHCAACHAAGPGHPGTQSLQLKYDDKLPAVLRLRTDLAPAGVKYFVRHGVGSMPFFRKAEISDEDIDKLALFLTQCSFLGNKSETKSYILRKCDSSGH